MAKRPDWKPAFLRCLEEVPNVSRAARAIGMTRRAVYAAAKISDEFHEAWEEALDVGVDRIEEELHNRAVLGVSRPVFQGGKHVGATTEYSDNLMIFLLKAHRPKRYRENSTIEHRGAAPVTIVNQWADLAGQPEGD